MKKILVYPDLYQGSSLDKITNQVIQAAKAIAINLVVVPFSQEKIELLDGLLDDPDIFVAHNIHTINSLVEIVEDGDKILFIDFFQPSLALLHYYIENKGIKVKYGALFHGATFIPEDFFANRLWMQPFELGIIELLDSIYVPSQYAARFFPLQAKSKVKVFYYGFSTEDYERNLCIHSKCFDVVIPHRWSRDKGVEFYAELIKAMPTIQFCVSRLGITSKDDNIQRITQEIQRCKNVFVVGSAEGMNYREVLAKSKVVVAANKQELFGYALREAMASGCIPVCINRACYPEFIPSLYLFNTIEQAIEIIELFVGSYPKYYYHLKNTSFRDILEDFYES